MVLLMGPNTSSLPQTLMPHHTNALHEAILLHERMRVCGVPNATERLLDLAPLVEAALSQETDGELWARAVLSLTIPLMLQGRYEEHLSFLQLAADRAQTHETLVWVKISIGRWQETYRHIPTSAKHWEELGGTQMTPLQRCYYAYNTSRTLRAMSRWEQAIALLTQTLETAKQHTFVRPQCMLLNDLGFCLLQTGEYDQARLHLLHATQLNDKHLHETQIALSLGFTLGTVYLAQRDYEPARAHYHEVRAIAQEASILDHAFAAWASALTSDLALGAYDSVSKGCAEIRTRSHSSLRVQPFRLLVLEASVAAATSATEVALPLILHTLDKIEREHDATSSQSLKLLAHVLDPTHQPLPEYEPSLVFSHAFYEQVQAQSLESPEELNQLERDLLQRRWSRPSLWAIPDFSKVSTDGERWIDLRRRAHARRLLKTLHVAYPGAVDAWTLFEHIWPDVNIETESALGRLYTCIYRLRGIGLQDIVLHTGESYLLSGPVRVISPAEEV